MSVKIKSNTLKVYRDGNVTTINALRGANGNDWIPTDEEFESMAGLAAEKLNHTVSEINGKIDAAIDGNHDTRIYAENIESTISIHENNEDVHIKSGERSEWNSKLNNISINSNIIPKDSFGVVDLPVSIDNGGYGVVRTESSSGVVSGNNGLLAVNPATDDMITEKIESGRPLVPNGIDRIVKSGMANSKISWSGYEKESARELLGIVVISAEEYALIDHDESTIYLIVG